MTTIAFTVLGEPMTKGSVTAFVPRGRDGSWVTRHDGAPVVVKHDDTGARGKAAAASVANAALAARVEANAGLFRDDPLVVTLRFFKARNRGHYGTGRNSGLLKSAAPLRPHKRPDIDKLTRHVLDALKGVLWTDDGQVVTLIATKEFAEGDEAPRTEVEVTPLDRAAIGSMAVPDQLALVA